MTDVPTAERRVETQPPVSAPAAAKKSRWPWLLLTLWAVWLAVLIILSFPELGRKRIPHDIPQYKLDQYEIKQ